MDDMQMKRVVVSLTAAALLALGAAGGAFADANPNAPCIAQGASSRAGEPGVMATLAHQAQAEEASVGNPPGAFFSNAAQNGC
jgi:hypothetical protein